tara:strand:- start:3180 stop:3689 length:510 start_codon:yes stop_codon:yes gene_type:complete
MLNRFITASSEAKILVFILVVLFLVLWFFLVREIEKSSKTSTENDVEASSVISPVIILPIDPPLKSKTTNRQASENIDLPGHDKHQHEISDKEVDIQKLMDEQIDNKARKEINEMLAFDESKYEIEKTEDGERIIFNNHSVEVAIGLKDKNGNTIVVNITSPMPLLKEK